MQIHYLQSPNIIKTCLLCSVCKKPECIAGIVIFIPFFPCFNNYWYCICMLPDNWKYKFYPDWGQGRVGRKACWHFFKWALKHTIQCLSPFIFRHVGKEIMHWNLFQEKAWDFKVSTATSFEQNWPYRMSLNWLLTLLHGIFFWSHTTRPKDRFILWSHWSLNPLTSKEFAGMLPVPSKP